MKKKRISVCPFFEISKNKSAFDDGNYYKYIAECKLSGYKLFSSTLVSDAYEAYKSAIKEELKDKEFPCGTEEHKECPLYTKEVNKQLLEVRKNTLKGILIERAKGLSDKDLGISN